MSINLLTFAKKVIGKKKDKNNGLEKIVTDRDSYGIFEGNSYQLPDTGRNLISEVRTTFNGNLENAVYSFMRDSIFNENFDYNSYHQVGKIMDYFERLSERGSNESKQALETAKTVLSHLEDYLVSCNPAVSFKEYLFGEEGVLTERRLKDMDRITKVVSKRDNKKIEEKREYVYSLGKGDEGFNTFNVSYTSDGARKFFNINDNNSLGMNTNHGRLYWENIDKMFSGEVDVRRMITKQVKKSLNDKVKKNVAHKIRGYDWKLNKFFNYIKLLK